jgi:hypothetical protein
VYTAKSFVALTKDTPNNSFKLTLDSEPFNIELAVFG